MVLVNGHESRVATVRVERRLPNRKSRRLAVVVVGPGQRLNVRALETFAVPVGEDSGSLSICSDLKVEVYL